jgi:mono/diheme cytochrome c family protein
MLFWALVGVFVLTLALAACSGEATQPDPTTTVAEPTDMLAATETPSSESVFGMGHRGGMGPGSGMMARHHERVPDPYAGMTNPIPADQASFDRGAELYTTLCASCHGDGGMGDGPTAASLDPVPAPLGHTSQMLGDDMLFWRISEGGVMEPFNSAMPSWKASLDEQARWDLVNYIRALGRGQAMPRQGAGGAPFDPAVERERHAVMLSEGVESGIITQQEADLFDKVHTAMDEQAVTGEGARVGAMGRMRDVLLAELIELGTITQEQADRFNDIHDRLVEAGLME